VQVYQSINDFSVPQWSNVVDIIRVQAANFYSDLTIRIETIAIVDKNLKPKAKLTRTDRPLEQSRSRPDVAEDVGEIDRQLTAYWQCHDKRCNNQNDYCFVDHIDKHYNIEAPEQRQ